MGQENKQGATDYKGLILDTENQYLTYWITNLELDFISFLEVARDDEARALIQKDAVLEKMVKYLIQTVSDTEKLLNPASRSTAMKRSTLKKHRSEIQSRVKVLSAYSDFVMICEYIINRKESQFDSTYHELESDEEFAGTVLQFIFENEDSMIINDKIKQIYAQLPIRMTKNRYFNYTDQVLSRLKGISQSDMDQYIANLKELFYPEGTPEFGVVLPELHARILQLKRIDAVDLDAKEYREIVALYESLADEIGETMNLYIIVVSIINELIGLLSVLNEESLEADGARIDHFTKLIASLNDKSAADELIDDEVNDLLIETEGVIESLVHTLGQQEILVEKALENAPQEIKNLDLTDRYETIGWLSALTSGSFFAEIDDVGQKDFIPVDASYLGSSQKELTQYLDGVLNDESKAFQRARMAMSFAGLHVIHTKPQEVYAFILDALDTCRDKGEKTMSRKMIRQLMSDM